MQVKAEEWGDAAAAKQAIQAIQAAAKAYQESL